MEAFTTERCTEAGPVWFILEPEVKYKTFQQAVKFAALKKYTFTLACQPTRPLLWFKVQRSVLWYYRTQEKRMKIKLRYVNEHKKAKK